RELPARQQIEDQVLLLGGGLHREVLGGAHGERQRQLFAHPSARVGRRRRRREGGRHHRRQQRREPRQARYASAHRHHHQLYTNDDVKTLFATVGAPASSRLSRYSAFKITASQRSTLRPPVIRSTV